MIYAIKRRQLLINYWFRKYLFDVMMCLQHWQAFYNGFGLRLIYNQWSFSTMITFFLIANQIISSTSVGVPHSWILKLWQTQPITTFSLWINIHLPKVFTKLPCLCIYSSYLSCSSYFSLLITFWRQWYLIMLSVT